MYTLFNTEINNMKKKSETGEVGNRLEETQDPLTRDLWETEDELKLVSIRVFPVIFLSLSLSDTISRGDEKGRNTSRPSPMCRT